MNTETTFWNCPPLAVVTVVQKLFSDSLNVCFQTSHSYSGHRTSWWDGHLHIEEKHNMKKQNKLWTWIGRDDMIWSASSWNWPLQLSYICWLQRAWSNKTSCPSNAGHRVVLCESSGRHLCTIPASHVSVDGSFSKNSSNLSMGIRMSQKFGTLKIHQNMLGPLRFLRLHLEIWAEGVHPTSWACGPFAHVGAFEPNGSQ